MWPRVSKPATRRNRLVKVKLLLTVLLFRLTVPVAFGDGCLIARQDFVPVTGQQNSRLAGREVRLITEPAQKAAIVYDRGSEQLIISPSFSGSARDVAWVVPVPSRPQVKILSGALFHELAQIVEPIPLPP